MTITIKGPRQMGKSSLLIRTIHTAVNALKRVALLDFQLFDKPP
ncbi:MAG: AAA-like domain-containing protein [Nostoc sp. DedQUE12b]|nr:AAA-like domain-containing protein [Nostoc sp. DedQUE12b]MDZ8086813.1 AAA-like domain-containing protein [Nostoc sp. DedQUE12b]